MTNEDIVTRLLNKTFVDATREEAAAEITRLRSEVERVTHANEMTSNVADARLSEVASLCGQLAEQATRIAELEGALRSVNTKVLREMADDFECGSLCEHCGPMDMETGVRDCSLEDRGETCRFVASDELRALAKEIEGQREGGDDA